jgi:hypothetical protein
MENHCQHKPSPEFLLKKITGNEMWVYMCDPQIHLSGGAHAQKQQNKFAQM